MKTLCIPSQSMARLNNPESLILPPESPLSLSLVPGTFPAPSHSMERKPQTGYELLLWSKALQMEGLILPLIDSLKASVDLLVKAGNAFPDDPGIDRASERFRRVIAARERAAEGLGIDIPS